MCKLGESLSARAILYFVTELIMKLNNMIQNISGSNQASGLSGKQTGLWHHKAAVDAAAPLET